MRPVISRSTILSRPYQAVWAVLAAILLAMGVWMAWSGTQFYLAMQRSIAQLEATPQQASIGTPDLNGTIQSLKAGAAKRLTLDLFKSVICFVGAVGCLRTSRQLSRARREAHDGAFEPANRGGVAKRPLDGNRLGRQEPQ